MVGTIYGAQQKADVLMKNWSAEEISEFVRGAFETLGNEESKCVVADWLPIGPAENVVQAIGKLQDLVDCIREVSAFHVSIKALEEINDLLDP